jgi:hypothetical protein
MTNSYLLVIWGKTDSQDALAGNLNRKHSSSSICKKQFLSESDENIPMAMRSVLFTREVICSIRFRRASSYLPIIYGDQCLSITY